MTNKISNFSKTLLVLAALFLIVAIFVPIWRIDLDAPQYPEGLYLQIWAYKLAGDVDIINGLNHYIGMRTLHTNDFIEFVVLPYIMGGIALFFLISALMGRKKLLYASLILFILFGAIGMYDFWKWEYDYGHNLDPNAAIQVPGMAYQPPLIGFKQLLNFGAYSMPDMGGWLMLAAGITLIIAIVRENKTAKRPKAAAVALLFIFSTTLAACTGNGPVPINLHKDACHHCKMSISDGRFAAEIITNKGRDYKFDDINCLLGYINEQANADIKTYYVSDFTKENELIAATNAWFVRHSELKSPMGGNTAAFTTQQQANEQAEKYETKAMDWNEILAHADSQNTGHDGHQH